MFRGPRGIDTVNMFSLARSLLPFTCALPHPKDGRGTRSGHLALVSAAQQGLKIQTMDAKSFLQTSMWQLCSKFIGTLSCLPFFLHPLCLVVRCRPWGLATSAEPGPQPFDSVCGAFIAYKGDKVVRSNVQTQNSSWSFSGMKHVKKTLNNFHWVDESINILSLAGTHE